MEDTNRFRLQAVKRWKAPGRVSNGSSTVIGSIAFFEGQHRGSVRVARRSRRHAAAILWKVKSSSRFVSTFGLQCILHFGQTSAITKHTFGRGVNYVDSLSTKRNEHSWPHFGWSLFSLGLSATLFWIPCLEVGNGCAFKTLVLKTQIEVSLA